MAETVFPNGVDVNAGHVGNVPAYVTADGARMASGTIGGTAAFVSGTAVSGLTTITHAVASLKTDAGTGLFTVSVSAIAGGTIVLKGWNSSAAAATTAGTAYWWAVGT